MLIVALGWIYVVLMAAVAEALSSQGTVLGAMMTFVLYGALPLAIVLYLMGTPGRKRRLRQELQAESAVRAATSAPSASHGLDPDRRGHAAGGTEAPIAPEGKEP